MEFISGKSELVPVKKANFHFYSAKSMISAKQIEDYNHMDLRKRKRRTIKVVMM